MSGPRWFVGIPLATNPLILLDVFSVLILAWGVMTVLLLGLQFVLGGYVDIRHPVEAISISGYVTAVFFLIFVLVAFVIQRNRYAALYRFEKDEVYCENLRAYPRPLESSVLPRWKGYAIEDVRDPIRSIAKCVKWADVRSVVSLEHLNVFLLKGKRSVLMRVYCPDKPRFEKARNAALEAIAAHKGRE